VTWLAVPETISVSPLPTVKPPLETPALMMVVVMSEPSFGQRDNRYIVLSSVDTENASDLQHEGVVRSCD
jgi:hypothetical protein